MDYKKQILILNSNIQSALKRAYDKNGGGYDFRTIQLYGPAYTYPMYEHDKLLLLIYRVEDQLEAFGKDPIKFESDLTRLKKLKKKYWIKLKTLNIAYTV